MKIAGIILALLMLLGSAFVGAAGSNKSMDLGDDLAKITDGFSDTQLEEAGLPSISRLKYGGIVGYLAALVAVGLLVVMFVKKDKIVHVAGAGLGLCILAVILYPGFEAGPNAGMAPRMQAIVAGALLLVGAAGAMMAKKGSEK